MFSTKGVERPGRNKEGGRGRILKPFHNLLFQIQVPSSCFSRLRISCCLKGQITHLIADMFVLSTLRRKPQSNHSHLCFLSNSSDVLSGVILGKFFFFFSMKLDIMHDLYDPPFRLHNKTTNLDRFMTVVCKWSVCHFVTDSFNTMNISHYTLSTEKPVGGGVKRTRSCTGLKTADSQN